MSAISPSKGNPARPRLTVAILVRHDARQLADAVDSVRNIADELLLVDAGSTDDLATVAEQSGARAVHHSGSDGFSVVRNAAMAAATGDWMLWLEADEQLDPAAAEKIRQLVSVAAQANTAYLMYVATRPTMQGGAIEQMAQLRLLPRRPGIEFVGHTRESAAESIQRQGMSLELLPCRILRSPADQDTNARQERARRDLLLLERDINQLGPLVGLLCNLGDVQACLENHAAARECYRRVIEHAPRGSTEQLKAYYGLLSVLADDELDQRVELCLQALDVFPLDAQLLCAMGNYLQTQGRLEMACRAYDSAVRFGQINPETWHVAEIAEVAVICLSGTLEMLDRGDEAYRILEEAVGQMAESIRLRKRLIDRDVHQGRLTEALAHCERLPAHFAHREAFRSAVRGACHAARGNWSPALSYLQTAYDAGCHETLCLRWLSAAHLAQGERDEATVVVRRWLEQDPYCGEAEHLLASLIEPEATPPATSQSNPFNAMPGNFRIDLPGNQAAGLSFSIKQSGANRSR